MFGCLEKKGWAIYYNFFRSKTENEKNIFNSNKFEDKIKNLDIFMRVKIFVDERKTPAALRRVTLYPSYDDSRQEDVIIKMFY